MAKHLIVAKSFVYAWRGLVSVWREEINFRIETLTAVIVLLAVWYFNFSYEEAAIVVLTIIIVLSGEMVNTALEDVCNKIEPDMDPVIGKIKDIMAGFVLVSAIGSIIIGILTFIHHFS